MTLSKTIKFLSLPAFALFSLTQIYYQIYFVLPYVMELIKNKVPSITFEQLKSMIYLWTTISIPIAGAIVWLIISAILYGLFKAFKINIKFSSTFLIFGHTYFISTISTCIAMFNPKAIYDMIIRGVIPWEYYVNSVIFGIVIPLFYLSVLYSREVEVRFTRVLIPVLIVLIIMFIFSTISMIMYKPQTF